MHWQSPCTVSSRRMINAVVPKSTENSFYQTQMLPIIPISYALFRFTRSPCCCVLTGTLSHSHSHYLNWSGINNTTTQQQQHHSVLFRYIRFSLSLTTTRIIIRQPSRSHSLAGALGKWPRRLSRQMFLLPSWKTSTKSAATFFRMQSLNGTLPGPNSLRLLEMLS